MSAQIIDGKKIAKEIRAELELEVKELRTKGIQPGLAVVLVGEDPASKVYVGMKEKTSNEMGLYSVTYKYSATLSQEDLLLKIDELNNDPKIHGILVQLPLPKQINSDVIIDSIRIDKDVDGFHPQSVGNLILGKETFVSCTPAGIMVLLEKSGIDPAGKHVVVLGRSNIVGKPMVNLMLQKKNGANATVTICHTGTRDFSSFTKQADILIAAMGQPKIVTKEMIKPGAVVIDVGTNRIKDATRKSGNRLVGDVDYEAASEIASYITPVPGGVGPMTIIMLMRNTIISAQRTLKTKT
jgi:methylenetetrahydrofolate dehydrogenase (NADP+) / methenyltetrahydrofolate cyclohydrolase